MRLFHVIATLFTLCALTPLARAQAPAAACTLAPVAGEMRELTSDTYCTSSARQVATGTFQRESSACSVATAKPSRAASASRPVDFA